MLRSSCMHKASRRKNKAVCQGTVPKFYAEENSQIANILTILSDINMSRSSCIIHVL